MSIPLANKPQAEQMRDAMHKGNNVAVKGGELYQRLDAMSNSIAGQTVFIACSKLDLNPVEQLAVSKALPAFAAALQTAMVIGIGLAMMGVAVDGEPLVEPPTE